MKTAVVLFNLGGPDSAEAVKPFLRNLFSDPAIIALPNPLRWLLAELIAGRRAPIAGEIYQKLGGSSPILANTALQSAALQDALGPDFKVLIAMRYWHPRAADTIVAAKAWSPDQIVLLPLYPQYSTTTTASSVREWSRIAHRSRFAWPTKLVCCYPDSPGLTAAVVERVKHGLADPSLENLPRRVLFSAHGLPQNIVDGGDPYAWQVERTVKSVVDALGVPGLDHSICYQSRVGPRKWLQPATENEIRRAGGEGTALVVVPIAFVSEHSETLVELDIEYAHLAAEVGVPAYVRVPTVDALAPFIADLAALVRNAATASTGFCPATISRLCPDAFKRCAFAELARQIPNP